MSLTYFAAAICLSVPAEDVKMVIGVLQLPVVVINIAILLEDSAAMKVERPLPDKPKGARLVKPLLDICRVDPASSLVQLAWHHGTKREFAVASIADVCPPLTVHF